MAKRMRRLTRAKDAVVEKTVAAKESVQNAAHRTGKYIDKNPRKSAAIAAGIGALVGAALLASRRKRGLFH